MKKKLYPVAVALLMTATGCYKVSEPTEPVVAASPVAPVAPGVVAVAAAPAVVAAPAVAPAPVRKKKWKKKKVEAPAAACDVETMNKVREEGRQAGLKEAKDALAKDEAKK